ncbi:uncharacterized protein LOC124153935 [Ischnura elegans]|uniref:uncharacterized protein LOC124153935 n=1 Tax=Ischnura elegans TaxID=197161 RepID=UPI001ED8BEDF|nr:uncharacterized protein LOC124153935 [Ischnura elegans]
MEKCESSFGDGNSLTSQDIKDIPEAEDSSDEYISGSDTNSTTDNATYIASESSTSNLDEEITAESQSHLINSSFFNLWETLREDIIDLRKEGLLEEGGALFNACKTMEYIRNYELWRRLAAERFSYSELFNTEDEIHSKQNLSRAIVNDAGDREFPIDEDQSSKDKDFSSHSSSTITYYREEEELHVHDYESYLKPSEININATEDNLDFLPEDQQHQEIALLQTSPNPETSSKVEGKSIDIDEALNEAALSIRSTFADADKNTAPQDTVAQVSSIKIEKINGESFKSETEAIPESERGDKQKFTGSEGKRKKNNAKPRDHSDAGKTLIGISSDNLDQVGYDEQEQKKQSNLEGVHTEATTAPRDSKDANEALMEARRKYLKETWYYDEINEDPGKCAMRTLPDEKTSYPLTEQSKIERRYKNRKEKAWKKWLDEKDREKRQRALLEIQSVMNAQRVRSAKKDWKIPTKEDIVEKEEMERLQARLKREKEIEERLSQEELWWKKKLSDTIKRRYEEEPKMRFTDQPIPKIKCLQCPKKEDTEEEAITHISSRDLLSVSQLPTIDSASESENPTNSAKRTRSEKPTGRAKKAANIENSFKENLKNMKDETKNCDIIYRDTTGEKLCKKEMVYGKFQVIPDMLIFKDFIPKQTYRQKLTVINLDGKPRQLCVVGMWYSHESLKGQGVLEFEKNTETTPKTVRINPGLKYDIWLVFKPRSVADSTAVSAQVVFWTGQGQLHNTKIKWAKEFRAQNPEEIKDEGFILTTVLCRQAQMDPLLLTKYVILDIAPQRHGTFRIPQKAIIIENNGAISGYFEIIKKSKKLPGHSRFRKGLQHATSYKKRNKSEQSSDPSLNVERNFSNEIPFKRKSLSLSDINTRQNVNKISSAFKIAKEVTEDVFEMATSCFELIPQYMGELPAKSSQAIPVKLHRTAFQSDQKRSFEKYVLKFDRGSKTPEISVWIGFRCQSQIDTLTVNKKKFDFGICRAGGRYQDFLEVSNTSGVVKGLILREIDEDMKEEVEKIKMPKTNKPPSNYTLEVHPSGKTFIQPNSNFSFSLRLNVRKAQLPSESFDDLSSNQNKKDSNKDQVNIKLELLEVTQTRDVINSGTRITTEKIDEISVMATFSDLAMEADLLPLKLDPTQLNLGRCVTTETICANINLISQSKVILEYGFLDLPKFVSLQPGYGFGKILPEETLPLNLLYSPLPEHGSTYPGNEFKFQLTCHNTFDEANPNAAEPAKMTVSATVIHIPDLRLSCSTLSFPVTPCGSYSIASITISSNEGLTPTVRTPKLQSTLNPRTCNLEAVNEKSLPESGYWFEFISQSEEITIAPRHGYLQPKQELAIKVFFQPKLEKQKIKSKAEELWKSDEKLLMENQMEIQRIREEKEATEGEAKGKKGEKKEAGKKKKKKDKKLNSKKKTKAEKETTTPKSPNSENADINESSLKPHEQGKLLSKEENKEKIKALLFPAEKKILESLEPFISQTKIACLVTKGYPSDFGTGISKALHEKTKAGESEWYDFMDCSGYSISRGCAWAIPPEEKIADVIWIDIICPVSQPAFIIRECGGEWLSEKETFTENSPTNFNELMEYKGMPIWSNMRTTHKQVVDFQHVAMGGGMKTLTIILQNIHPTPIKIYVPSLTNPFGPFVSPLSHLLGFSEVVTIEKTQQEKDLKSERLLTKYVSIPTEGLIKIPVTFTPNRADEVIELMDLKGSSADGIMTYATIELKGTGELPNYNFHPRPPIVTIKSSKSQKPAVLKIQNQGNAVLNFHVGEITEVFEPEKKSKKQKGKGKKESPRDTKKAKTKGKAATDPKLKKEEKSPKKEKDVKKTGRKGKNGGKGNKNAKLDGDKTKGKENSQGVADMKHEEEDELVKEHLSPEDVFSMEPQGVVQVLPNENKELKFYLLQSVKDVRKIFTFPLHLFGRGKEVANVTVKVVNK